MTRILYAGGAILVAVALIWFIFFRGSSAATGDLVIESAPAEARDISRIVSSSGAIAPLITVEVGSQLSGQILELQADFNDQVSSGDLLARIDPQTFETRVEEAQASLEVASAQVAVAQANLERSRVDLQVSQRSFDRAQELVQRGTYSQAQYDTAESALAAANAALLVAQANLRNARASELQRRASLESAQVDLERTFIRSPIEGVVIDRQIDEGQTVAASFNAPVLFLIAQDLSRIQIEAEIDEADIGELGQTRGGQYTTARAVLDQHHRIEPVSGIGQDERRLPAGPVRQLFHGADHVEMGHAQTGVSAALDGAGLNAGLVLHDPDLGRACAVARQGERQGAVLCLVNTRGGNRTCLVKRGPDPVGVKAQLLGRAVEDEMGRIDPHGLAGFHIGFLAIHESGHGELVRPAIGVPVIHAPGQCDHILLCAKLGQKLVGGGAERAAL